MGETGVKMQSSEEKIIVEYLQLQGYDYRAISQIKKDDFDLITHYNAYYSFFEYVSKQREKYSKFMKDLEYLIPNPKKYML